MSDVEKDNVGLKDAEKRKKELETAEGVSWKLLDCSGWGGDIWFTDVAGQEESLKKSWRNLSIRTAEYLKEILGMLKY